MRFVVAFAVLLFAPTSPGAALEPLSPHPEGLAWPTDEWPTGSLPEGLDLSSFEESVAALLAPKGRAGIPDTRAILVVQGGRIVFEHYAEGFGPESLFQSYSMAKSLTNALTGVLVRQERLSLDERAGVPEWSESGDPRRSLTLRHLLEMRSGLDNADGFGVEDLTKTFAARLIFGEGSRSPATYAANVPLLHPIGTRWAYSSGTSIVIARLCGEIIGGGETGTRDFLRREIFLPIGMRSAQPEFAKSGEFIGSSFAHATARDWARFGYLYLRDGVWEGRRILPEGWVDFTRTPNPAENNRTYGAHFWVNGDPQPEEDQLKWLPGGPPSVFLAFGMEFQMVAIAPTKDVVAVRLGIAQGMPVREIIEPFGPMISAFPDRR